MAKSSSVVNYAVTLELSSFEARWLQAYLQNPLIEGCEPEDDREVRKALFQSLKEANDSFRSFEIKVDL